MRKKKQKHNRLDFIKKIIVAIAIVFFFYCEIFLLMKTEARNQSILFIKL